MLKDAADVSRALVVLDRRYKNVPGWVLIRGHTRLDRAAEVCAVFAGYAEPDYSVDEQGWRPSPATIDGGPLPGIDGVLQAERNMLAHLTQFPNALNLRRVLDSQRILSHEAARRAPHVAPDPIERWLDREQVYTRSSSKSPATPCGADTFGRLDLDQFLQRDPDRLADQIRAITGTERLEQLRQGRLE